MARVKPANLAGATPALERNVVLGALGRAAFVHGGRRLTEVLRGGAAARCAASLAALAGGEKDHAAHRIRDHLGGVLLGAFLVGPLPRLQPALDIDLPALGQVLAAQLCGLAPDHDAVPLGAFLLLALLVGPVLVGGDGEVGYRLSAGRVSDFGILAQIAYQDDLVDAAARHDCLWGKRSRNRSTGVRQSKRRFSAPRPRGGFPPAAPGRAAGGAPRPDRRWRRARPHGWHRPVPGRAAAPRPGRVRPGAARTAAGPRRPRRAGSFRRSGPASLRPRRAARPSPGVPAGSDARAVRRSAEAPRPSAAPAWPAEAAPRPRAPSASARPQPARLAPRGAPPRAAGPRAW